jgi:ATP-dependent Clp protease ATP-binding subunit ClpA
MFERFTSQARAAVVHAQGEARGLRHPRIGTQHVLVGLLVEPVGAGGRALRALGLELRDARADLADLFPVDRPGIAAEDAEALRTLGIDLDEVRRAVEEGFGEGALERRWTGGGHLAFDPAAKKVLELSLREALRLGAKHIGTEHILLGLLREGGRSGAARILEARGIDPDGLRAELDREIARGGDRPERTA